MKVYHIFMKIKNKDVGFTTFLYVIFPTSLLYHLHRESCEDSDEYKKIDLSYWREGSGGVYYWFCRKVGLKEDIMNDVENNELYISTLSHSEFSPRGILLNRKRGLVAIFA